MQSSAVDLRKAFEAFRNDCMDLDRLWTAYFDLFDNEPKVENRLRDIAGWFLDDFNGWAQELIFLKICRLTDPSSSFGRPNNTALFFIETLSDAGGDTEELRALYAPLERYRSFLKPARNKHIAHADQKTRLSNEILGAHPQADMLAFPRCLQEFCDVLARATGADPSAFIGSPGERDAKDLVRFLIFSRATDLPYWEKSEN